MMNDSGQLSIDFIIGFTIFMLSFIFVAILMSGLLVGLQSKTIDYDAVAYRTGVILVEDPGNAFDRDPSVDASVTYWEMLDKDAVKRFGLAIATDKKNILSRDYPNILSDEKIEKFFNNPYSFSDDEYKSRLIFGDFPYHYNIYLRSLDDKILNPLSSSIVPSITVPKYEFQRGDDYSLINKYGYIRRSVMIKEPGSATFSLTSSPPPLTSKNIIISIDLSKLSGTARGELYQLDPLSDQTAINIDNFNSLSPKLAGISLDYYPEADSTPISFTPPPYPSTIRIYSDTLMPDEDLRWIPSGGPISINNNVLILIDPEYIRKLPGIGEQSKIDIQLTFDSNVIDSNNNLFSYDYDNTAVTPPFLIPAVLEVRVW